MSKTFVVTERQPLVRVDLEQQLREVAPAAIIYSFATPEAALARLDEMEALTGAVSGASIDELRHSGFARRVAQLGAWLVCASDRPKGEIAEAGWHLLKVPFSGETAQRLFVRLIHPLPEAGE